MTSGEDVAREAGVSLATVSAVFSGLARERRIAEKTEQRIREIAERLNYKPNMIARSFRKGRTSTIGILLPVPNDNGYTRIVNELSTRFYERGYFAAFAFWRTGEEQKVATETIVSRMPEAIVTVEPDLLPPNLKIPVVTLFKKNSGFDYVTVDRKAIFSDTLEYFLENGHTRIAAPALFPEKTSDEFNEYSEAANFFRSELTRHGLSQEFCATLLRDFSPFASRDDAGKRIADWLLSFPAERRPTALVLDEDANAAHTIRMLSNAGYCVPRDISIISSGNTQLGRATLPALTTFGENPDDSLSRRIAERILLRLEEPDLPRVDISVKYLLSVRESVMPYTGKEWCRND